MWSRRAWRDVGGNEATKLRENEGEILDRRQAGIVS